MPSGEITRIQRSPTGPATVHVDGREWTRVPRAVARRLDLSEGQTHDLGRLRAEVDAAMAPSARERAYRLLAARERSRRELLRTLARDGYPERVAEEVVARLEDVGAVDDRRFAETLARSLAGLRGHGRSRVAHALLEAGVDDAVRQAVLDACCPLQREDERALRAAVVLARTCAGRADRLAARLARRGFSTGAA
ncbi:MAG: RecX family transcriptional regulator, partial [Coriobacteriia bacterium]|nr:RecX family transcriptional regulator [Coriobacteriia bacterium]